jgi:DNA-directed RNA polymerase subunit F
VVQVISPKVYDAIDKLQIHNNSNMQYARTLASSTDEEQTDEWKDELVKNLQFQTAVADELNNILPYICRAIYLLEECTAEDELSKGRVLVNTPDCSSLDTSVQINEVSIEEVVDMPDAERAQYVVSQMIDMATTVDATISCLREMDDNYYIKMIRTDIAGKYALTEVDAHRSKRSLAATFRSLSTKLEELKRQQYAFRNLDTLLPYKLDTLVNDRRAKRAKNTEQDYQKATYANLRSTLQPLEPSLRTVDVLSRFETISSEINAVIPTLLEFTGDEPAIAWNQLATYASQLTFYVSKLETMRLYIITTLCLIRKRMTCCLEDVDAKPLKLTETIAHGTPPDIIRARVAFRRMDKKDKNAFNRDLKNQQDVYKELESKSVTAVKILDRAVDDLCVTTNQLEDIVENKYRDPYWKDMATGVDCTG